MKTTSSPKTALWALALTLGMVTIVPAGKGNEANGRRDHNPIEAADAGGGEDRGTMLALSRNVKVPYGTFRNCFETKDFSLIKLGVVEHKFYAPGIGFVSSVMVKGGKERLDLVHIVREPTP